MERLQKVIAQAGITSRRRAEQLILDAKVMVNGQIVQELGIKVNPEKDDIRVNGKRIYTQNQKVVILFNKPPKVITSMDDPQGRKKVIDYIDIKQRIYPVGRLDYDTKGLLLLTNDGQLANRLMHPSYEFEKTYEVIITGRPTDIELDKIRSGVPLEEGLTSPSEVKIIDFKGTQTKLLITIHEGKYRQIRRMFQYINFPVINLKRIKYGFLTLKGVPEGKYRILSANEICKLKKMVQLHCN